MILWVLCNVMRLWVLRGQDPCLSIFDPPMGPNVASCSQIWVEWVTLRCFSKVTLENPQPNILYIYIYMVWFRSSRVLPLNFSCWNASVIRLPVTQYMPRDSPFNSFHLPRPTLVIREMSLRNLIGFTIFVWCRMLEKVAGQDASSCKHNPNKSPKGSLFSFCMLVLSYVELTL